MEAGSQDYPKRCVSHGSTLPDWEPNRLSNDEEPVEGKNGNIERGNLGSEGFHDKTEFILRL